MKAELLEALKKVERKGFFGICYNLSSVLFEDENCNVLLQMFYEMFVDWPKYSGNVCYPVPHPDYPKDPGEAGWMFNNADRLWEGPYGELRIELLDFCIEKLEKELSK